MPVLTYPLPNVLGVDVDDEVGGHLMDLTVLQSACGSVIALFALPFSPGCNEEEKGVAVNICPIPYAIDQCDSITTARLEFFIHSGCPHVRADQHLVVLPTFQTRLRPSLKSRHLLVLNCGDLVRFVEVEVSSHPRNEKDDVPQGARKRAEKSYFPQHVQIVPPNSSWWGCADPLDITYDNQSCCSIFSSSSTSVSALTPASTVSSSAPPTVKSASCSSCRVVGQASFEAEPFVGSLLQGVILKLYGGHAMVTDFHIRIVEPLFRPQGGPGNTITTQTLSGSAHDSGYKAVDDSEGFEDGEFSHRDHSSSFGSGSADDEGVAVGDDDGIGTHVLMCIIAEVGCCSPSMTRDGQHYEEKHNYEMEDENNQKAATGGGSKFRLSGRGASRVATRVGVAIALDWRTGLAAVLRTARLDALPTASAVAGNPHKYGKHHAGSSANSRARKPPSSLSHLSARFASSCRAAFVPRERVLETSSNGYLGSSSSSSSAASTTTKMTAPRQYTLTNAPFLHGTSMPCLLNPAYPVGISAATGRLNGHG
mmetsp:Transcript_47832/g.94853  ORF Transcript_47832/g.94853 Transcript_47832/m.94853 type:complete len:538 (-) Transcript_47832:120-1733(-)